MLWLLPYSTLLYFLVEVEILKVRVYFQGGKFNVAVFEVIVKLLIISKKIWTSVQKSGVYLVCTSFVELILQHKIILLSSLFVIRHLNQT